MMYHYKKKYEIIRLGKVIDRQANWNDNIESQLWLQNGLLMEKKPA